MGTILREGPLPWGMAWGAWLAYQCERRQQYPGMNIELDIPAGADGSTAALAATALVERHEILRTTFGADEDGLPVQHVWEPEPVRLHELDPAADPDCVEAFKNRDFALDTEWPSRFALVARPGRASLLACFSHIATDNHAGEILIRDLRAIVDAVAAGRAPDLDPVACQPLDYARFERSERTAAMRARSERYWRDRLQAVPVATFDAAEVPATCRFRNCRFESPTAAGRLARIADRAEVPVSAVFSAVFCVALGAVTGKTVLPLDIASHGRLTSDALEVVAPLARDVVMPVALDPGQPFDAFAAEVHRLTFEAIRYSMVPTFAFDEWKAIAGGRRGGRIGSRITLNFMHKTGDGRGEDPTGPLDAWECELTGPVAYSASTHHLYMSAAVSPNGLELFISANETVLGGSRVAALREGVTGLLELLDGDAGRTVGDLARTITDAYTPPAGRPAVRGDSVDPAALDAMLARHPAIAATKTEVDGDGLTTTVEVTDPALDEQALIRFMNTHRPFREALRTLPDRIAVSCTGEPASAAGASGLSDAAAALVRCAERANGIAAMDAGCSYAENGGAFHRIPAVLRLMEELGYEGLNLHDLQIPCSLAVLSTRISAAPQ